MNTSHHLVKQNEKFVVKKAILEEKSSEILK